MIDAPDILELFQSSLELFAKWPLVAMSVGLDMVTLARQAAITRNFRFWRRQADHSRTPLPLALLPLAALLKSLGYRRTTAGLFLNLQDSVVERTVSQLIADITDRVGRKAVLIAHSTGMPLVVRAAGVHRETVSDVVLLEAPHKLIADDVRIHFISSGWFMLRTMIELPRLSKAF